MVFVSRLLLEKCREQQRDASFAFIDLTKALDTISRPLLWNVLQRYGCPPKLLAMLRKFHDGMQSRVTLGFDHSDYCNVQVGVEQGCVLAPVLFNVFLVDVTLLSRYDLNLDDGIPLRYRHDGSLFNLRRVKSLTKTQSTTLFELQYAEDCEALVHEPSRLQQNLDIVGNAYRRPGLQTSMTQSVTNVSLLHTTIYECLYPSQV
ncbi:Hypothetical predicted protein [Octopus vulgaris]|uniref:Reverse transcriptase domain-containing protein n=1 Tax=Octopus vulgaris TaxID=6645 RepID=A0AA36AK18_OCTVU|nr:Hypothetical predicted protein [Octopus vulgaris]